MNRVMDFLHNLSPKQREAYNQFVETKGGLAFWKVGTGKTRIGILTAIASLVGESHMIAVICRRAAFYDWRNEVATLQLDWWQTPEIEDFDKDTVFNIESFVLVSDGLLRNPSIIATLQSLINKNYLGAIIVDEGYLYCNPASQRSKALRQLTCQLPTVVLSGSIMPARDLTQIYGQAIAASKNALIAPTLTKFRQAFMKGIQGNFFSWYPKPGAYKAIMEKMAPFTNIHMPPNRERTWHEQVLKVRPYPEQTDALRQLKTTWAVDDKVELNNALTVIQQGQYISNGYLKGKEGDVTYIPSSKVDRAVALIQEILASDDKQVVVWCAYREDIKRLRHALDEEGEATVAQRLRPNSRIATLQSGDLFDVQAWKAKKQCICLATEDSGSSINHFEQVPYAIYFSQNFKWLSLQQSQGRHDRASSQHRDVYFYFLHTERSPDARVHYTVKGAAGAERSFIQQFDVSKWIGEI